jgi:uncharacterized protein (TIGR00661 family)
MAKAFYELGIEVDWIFSGRKTDQLFDMQPFGDYRVFSGLTFAIDNGSIPYFKTAFQNNLFNFFRDVCSIDFSGYDHIFNDFEPITAWAAKLRRAKTIGIPIRWPFRKKTIAGKNWIAHSLLKNFARVHTHRKALESFWSTPVTAFHRLAA